ncbi:MAG: hypothetical protein IJL75_02665 [Eubacterium sp.]|nr:hypothetical protein [Eubacterium sp.]
MKSETIRIEGKQTKEIRIADFVEGYCKDKGYDNKTSLRMRLLAEELVCLISSMEMEIEGDFFVESDEKEINLRLNMRTFLYPERKKELMSLATVEKKKPKGVLGKLSQVVQGFLAGMDEDEVHQMQLAKSIPYGMYGMTGSCMGNQMMESMTAWSLQRYRDAIDESIQNDNNEEEEKDELEKSVLANIADEVSVEIKSNKVLLSVVKKV